MKKDAYYFPHDSNAKDDPKCVMLIEQLGMEGYGIYWVLIETLRDQPGYRYPLALIPALARRYNTQSTKLDAVVNGYGLFKVENGDFFYSESLDKRMLSYDAKRDKARLAGQRSGEIRRQISFNGRSTDVQQAFNSCSTDLEPEEKIREEEIREENIKDSMPGDKPPDDVKKNFKIPTLEEVKAYCIERKNGIDPQSFIDFYSAKGWMIGKNKMKDWKASVRTWEKNRNGGNHNGTNQGRGGPYADQYADYKPLTFD